jgi:hypothetical protein
MQHKGIEYTIQARPGPHQWTWTIYLDGGRTKRGEMKGTRATAESRAIRAINDWLQSQRTKIAPPEIDRRRRPSLR